VDTKTGFKTRNIMCVPLKAKKGGVIGVVNLLNKISTDDLASFSAEDQQFLLVFASQAATAITTGGGLPQPKPKEVSQRELRSDSFFGLRGFLCCAQRERAVVVDGEAQVSGPRLLAVPRLNRLNDMTATHSTGVAVSSTTTSAWTQAEVSITSPRLVIPSPCVSDGESDDDDMDDCFEELEVARFLAEAFDSWTMDAHRLVEITGNKPLSTLGCYLCERLGLVQEFRLHPQRLRRFLKEVERGYSEANPYHNSAHAASVMHLMHVLMHRGDVASAAAKACEGPEGLGSTNRSLVQLAGLLAAAVHDYEHEGVTNDFLVKTHNEKAVRYNDQRVNEEHHVAAACTTLIRPECHFVRDMPLADFRQLRSLIIDLVVHTDMGEHDRTLAHFMKILDDAAREDRAASSEAEDDQKKVCPGNSSRSAVVATGGAEVCRPGASRHGVGGPQEVGPLPGVRVLCSGGSREGARPAGVVPHGPQPARRLGDTARLHGQDGAAALPRARPRRPGYCARFGGGYLELRALGGGSRRAWRQQAMMGISQSSHSSNNDRQSICFSICFSICLSTCFSIWFFHMG